MSSINNKPMSAKEKEDVTQAFIDIYRGNTDKYKTNTRINKTTYTKKKLCSTDKVRLQEVTIELLKGH